MATDYYETPVELRVTGEIGGGNTVTAGAFYNNQMTEQDSRVWGTNDRLQLNAYKVMTLAGYVQDVWKPTRAFTLMAGLRYDYWENYDNHFSGFVDPNPRDRTDDNLSPKLGVRYNFTDDISIWGNYGMGFKPPTSTQLYDDRTSGGNPRQPNPDLKSEKTQSWELGVEKWFGNLVQANLVGFYNYTDDKILSWFDTNNVWVNKNVGGSESYGTEFSLEWYLSDHLTLDANYTYMVAVIDENPANPSQEGNDLPFSPRHNANFGINYKVKDNFSMGISARYLSDQYTNDDNTTQNAVGADLVMDESFVVDIKAVKHLAVSWGFVKKVDVSLGVNNLFDEAYRTYYMYEDPGIVFSTEVSFRF
jgi:iron complex outermembrane receptor protein